MSETGGETRRFRTGIRKPLPVGEIMLQVHAALVEKGYNPVSQIAGFILSGDPTYITNHKGARSLVHGLTATRWWRSCCGVTSGTASWAMAAKTCRRSLRRSSP